MHKRTAHRWRLTAIMLAATFAAFGTFWLVQMMESDPGLSSDAFKNEPDYIVEKFSFVRMTPDGKPRYIVSGDKLTHRPLDDSAEIEKPFLQGLGAGQPETVVRAKRARVDHGNTQVHLMGDVDIDRKATPDARPVRMRTQALTVFTEEDQMQTDQPVEIVSGGSKMTGTGLFIDNAARKVQIQSRSRITYPPRQ
ncbi:LPS export ABC transporter periplasmic protein LptC [Massilia cavernae]|uniref:LPS export ABC transporter periplasmic protein LptC n=1 Tax=Massilia cavernae TaxID=2320864 RepID=A0A418XDQ3_9BURK|nr:LPS export ABC transporter periplasmic protein LptC [Massilia cavernae]RJG10672.1 LPS export ABC transporter periplasmic protein LptC [Massilia cavernae]